MLPRRSHTHRVMPHPGRPHDGNGDAHIPWYVEVHIFLLTLDFNKSQCGELQHCGLRLQHAPFLRCLSQVEVCFYMLMVVYPQIGRTRCATLIMAPLCEHGPALHGRSHL